MVGQRLRRAFALGLIGVAGALSASACADSESTLYIAYAIPADEQCVASPQSDIYIPEGSLDTMLATSYGAFLVIHNEIVEQGDPNRPKTETSRVLIYDSEISVEDPVSGYTTSYSWPLAGFVPEGPDGQGVVSVLMLDNASVQAVRDSLAAGEVRPVLVTVQIFGRTTGGIELETPEWTFTIGVGACINVDCSAEWGEENDAGEFEACSKEADPLEVCHPGQDVAVPCNAVGAAIAGTCCGIP